ncbi:MAG: hemerythrin family protein [Spirochaetales bacterium]|nr:hemerythrin family protein [Spirochaetales bacterium]
MSLITWSESYSVGVKLFDEQHQKLIEIINRLYEAMKIGQGKTVIGEILKELSEYTIYHFQAEEEKFDLFSYPGKDSHKEEHQILIDKVKKLQEEHQAEKLLVSINTMKLLNDWIINHINGSDKKYTSFFKDKDI